MRFLFILVSFLCFFSCSEYQKTLKSDDVAFKYTQAMQYYENQDYARSLQLFESIITSFNDLKKSEDVYYHYIYSNFYMKDYITAAYHFNNFNLKFPLSDKKEEMTFMLAYCQYLQSPRYTLDQEKTYEALSNLQQFSTEYPNSNRMGEVNELVLSLNKKLQKKEFEIVQLYYQTGRFPSAIYAIDEFLTRFPETDYVEDVNFIQLQAYYELGKNSITEKKEQRIKEAIFACDNFLLAFPSSNYKNEIESIYEKLKDIQNGL